MTNSQQENIYNPLFVKELFNRMSHSYERMNFIFSFGFTHLWRKAMIKKVITEQSDDFSILDLMTGMGETWSLIKEYYPKAKLSGLDISDAMLSKAAIKNRTLYNNTVNLIQEDALSNSLESEKYDLIVCAFGLKTFNEQQIKTLAEQTKRILKPNGRFSFVEISSPQNPLLNLFFRLYIGKITPIITRFFMGNPDEYKMLWMYTKNFGSTKRTTQIFNEVGLTAVSNSYFWGCATGLHGTKSSYA